MELLQSLRLYRYTASAK